MKLISLISIAEKLKKRREFFFYIQGGSKKKSHQTKCNFSVTNKYFAAKIAELRGKEYSNIPRKFYLKIPSIAKVMNICKKKFKIVNLHGDLIGLTIFEQLYLSSLITKFDKI